MSIELHSRRGVLVGRLRVPGGLLGGARLLRQPHDGQEAHPQSGEENAILHMLPFGWGDVSAEGEGVFAKVRPKGARLN